MAKSKQSLGRWFFSSLAWSEHSTKKESVVLVPYASFLARFLHALSYTRNNLVIDTRFNPPLEDKVNVEKLGRLWSKAHVAMRSKRHNIAEKFLYQILEIDNYNAAAYNRLGILYAQQKKYKQALESFTTAVKLEPTPASTHNLGLIYYEVSDYKNSLKAFKRSLDMEDDLAARHVAVAKVHEKLGNEKMMFKHLEIAAQLEPSKEIYILLSKAYREYGHPKKSIEITRKTSRRQGLSSGDGFSKKVLDYSYSI